MYRFYQKFSIILMVCLNIISFYSHSFIINFLKDIYLITETLDKFNENNRNALASSFKKIINQDIVVKYSDNEQFKTKTDNKPEKTFTFQDLGGYIPEDIKEVVDFLRYPEKFKIVGAKMPKGILLVGPPGTGKTSIARAIAGEADAEFFHACATEFIEVFVGIGSQRIRELFNNANEAIKNSPNKKAIIFIDEIDAIGGLRTQEQNSEYRNTLNELLNQMDGFKQNHSILVIAATNTPNNIDPALKRPGRFDRIVEIGLPDEQSRKDILKLYCKKINCDENLDLEKIAILTKSFSAADLQNLVNEAAVRAARQNFNKVTEKNFEEALESLKSKRRYNRNYYN